MFSKSVYKKIGLALGAVLAAGTVSHAAFADSIESVTYVFTNVYGGVSNSTSPFTQNPPATFLTTSQSGNHLSIPTFQLEDTYHHLIETDLTVSASTGVKLATANVGSVHIGDVVAGTVAKSVWKENGTTTGTHTSTYANNTAVELYDATGSGPFGTAGNSNNPIVGGNTNASNPFTHLQTRTLQGAYQVTATNVYQLTDSTLNVAAWETGSAIDTYYAHKQFYTATAPTSGGTPSLSSHIDPTFVVGGSVTYYYVVTPVPTGLVLGLVALVGLVASSEIKRNRKLSKTANLAV